MKKLLVLTLVLSIASLANAGLVVFDGINYDTVTGNLDLLGVVSGDTNVAICTNGPAITQSMIILGPAMPTDASGFFFNVSDLFTLTDIAADASDGVIWTIGTYLSGVYPTATGGTILSTNVVFGTATKAYVFECDGDGNMISDITAYDLPEPVTMLLLGLGGLFIRRK